MSDCLLKSACRIYGLEKAKLALGEREWFESNGKEQVCHELVIECVRNYKTMHKTLNNILKFSDQNVMGQVLEYVKQL